MLYIRETLPINTVHINRSTTEISQLTDLYDVIKKYKKVTFRPFSERYLRGLGQNSAVNISNKLYSSYLASVSSSYFTTSARDIYHYESLLKEQLASPKSNLNHPIIDQLWITVPMSRRELYRLRRLVKGREYSAFCALNSHNLKYKGNHQESEIYKHCWHFKFSDQKDHRIVIYHGLIGGNSRQHPLKIAFNPARFIRAEIKKFFSWIRNGKVFDDFTKSMSTSNITRLDIATDFIGISTPMFFAVNDISKHTNYEPKRPSHDCELVQTQVLGNPAQSHYDVYSRNHKLLSVVTAGMLLLNDVGEPIPITRVERCWRPQKSNTPCSLGNIEGAPSMWKSFSIYSPRLIKEIQSMEDKRFIARHGFSHWLYSNRSNISDNALKRERLYINKEEFDGMQRKGLKVLKKLILGS